MRLSSMTPRDRFSHPTRVFDMGLVFGYACSPPTRYDWYGAIECPSLQFFEIFEPHKSHKVPSFLSANLLT